MTKKQEGTEATKDSSEIPNCHPKRAVLTLQGQTKHRLKKNQTPEAERMKFEENTNGGISSKSKDNDSGPRAKKRKTLKVAN